MARSAPAFWQTKNLIALCLYPVTLVFTVISFIRRWCYRHGVLRSYRPPIPVVMVGNLTAGGAGKTPLVIALANHMQQLGLTVGVVSGGYGGNRHSAAPVPVSDDSDPAVVGDESVLIAQRTGLPVVVCKDRSAAARSLVESCEVLLCDDGLQHYALQRDIEIVVIDAQRGLGNKMLMPSGPLRESSRRLHSIDLVCYSGTGRTRPGYQLQPSALMNVHTGSETALEQMRGESVHAVAAIAYPDKFFNMLKEYQLQLIEHRFPDHHAFSAADLQFNDNLPIVLTEKDKVKCRGFGLENLWYLPVTAVVDTQFMDSFNQQLQRVGVLPAND